jgi:hypothetical protein
MTLQSRQFLLGAAAALGPRQARRGHHGLYRCDCTADAQWPFHRVAAGAMIFVARYTNSTDGASLRKRQLDCGRNCPEHRCRSGDGASWKRRLRVCMPGQAAVTLELIEANRLRLGARALLRLQKLVRRRDTLGEVATILSHSSSATLATTVSRPRILFAAAHSKCGQPSH